MNVQKDWPLRCKLSHSSSLSITVADLGFPVGGRAPVRGGVDLRCGHFSVKMYVETKELGPIWGACTGHTPQIRQCIIPFYIHYDENNIHQKYNIDFYCIIIISNLFYSAVLNLHDQKNKQECIWVESQLPASG